MGANQIRYYSGVGSRETPPEVLNQMYDIAGDLACLGYRLRSGGAKGADEFFYKGAGALAGGFEIFLPKEKFRGFISQVLGDGSFITHEIAPEAFETAEKLLGPSHWANLGDNKIFHARNCHQVLGANLDSPVDFVLCWTEGGKQVGGTATAMKLATNHGIPIVNMYFDDWRQSLKTVLQVVR